MASPFDRLNGNPHFPNEGINREISCRPGRMGSTSTVDGIQRTRDLVFTTRFASTLFRFQVDTPFRDINSAFPRLALARYVVPDNLNIHIYLPSRSRNTTFSNDVIYMYTKLPNLHHPHHLPRSSLSHSEFHHLNLNHTQFTETRSENNFIRNNSVPVAVSLSHFVHGLRKIFCTILLNVV